MTKRRWLALLAGAAACGAYQAFVAPLMPAAEGVVHAWIPQAIGAAAAVYSALKSGGGGGGAGEFATADFENWRIQRGLPSPLRKEYVNPWLRSGLNQIGDMVRNPGQLSPTVSDAIRPRLAMQSENIGQQFRGMREQKQGMAARTNAPMSIKNALSSALDVAQERAQRDTRRGALTDSDQLRRQDLGQVWKVLEMMFEGSRQQRGLGAAGMASSEGVKQQNSASNMALIGSLLQSMNQGNNTTTPTGG